VSYTSSSLGWSYSSSSLELGSIPWSLRPYGLNSIIWFWTPFDAPALLHGHYSYFTWFYSFSSWLLIIHQLPRHLLSCNWYSLPHYLALTSLHRFLYQLAVNWSSLSLSWMALWFGPIWWLSSCSLLYLHCHIEVSSHRITSFRYGDDIFIYGPFYVLLVLQLSSPISFNVILFVN